MRRRPDNELIDLARKGSAEAAYALFDRHASGQWNRMRRGKLVAFGSNLYNRTYFANFTDPRGLTLRAFVPAKTATPCWTSAVSDTFTS